MSLKPSDLDTIKDFPQDWEALLMRECDESDYTLDAWHESLRVMNIWLTEQGRTISFEQAHSYLDCCAQSERLSGYQSTLTTIVAEMLDKHGIQENA